ncbi:nucleotidyltransferase family protein [Plasticicumulans sp.]|uniref:nucleotidyltransferase family protein n=1 Tax=Plasticicumulans sp. TaxID=2307179 RepID=UPI00394A6C21
MQRTEALTLLSHQRAVLRERFGVRRLALFGSTARNEARDSSDLDLLVEFDGPPTFRAYMGVKFLLEDALQIPVDLVVADSVREPWRPQIERECIDVP